MPKKCSHCVHYRAEGISKITSNHAVRNWCAIKSYPYPNPCKLGMRATGADDDCS